MSGPRLPEGDDRSLLPLCHLHFESDFLSWYSGLAPSGSNTARFVTRKSGCAEWERGPSQRITFTPCHRLDFSEAAKGGRSKRGSQ